MLTQGVDINHTPAVAVNDVKDMSALLILVISAWVGDHGCRAIDWPSDSLNWNDYVARKTEAKEDKNLVDHVQYTVNQDMTETLLLVGFALKIYRNDLTG